MPKISTWAKEADYRIRNRAWRLHSSKIARRILSAMDDLKITKAQLARNMGVSGPYITQVLKGNTNLTLETITKFEKALKVKLICFPHYKYMDPIK